MRPGVLCQMSIGRNVPGTRAHDIAGTGPHDDDERLFRIIDVLDAVAAETGQDHPQVALNWLLQRPTVATIIIGARDEQQLIDDLGAVGSVFPIPAARVSSRCEDVRPMAPPPCRGRLRSADRGALQLDRHGRS
jgi:aryl-alcohol dehydrogenase-like predicted oxidoreductase